MKATKMTDALVKTTPSGAFDMDAAPLQTAWVRLIVRDLDRVARFYREALGLTDIAADADRLTLGHDGAPLVELIARREAAPRDSRDAGLFHTAFLLPGRADLGRWLAHAVATGLRLHGASDHLVSEAVYLADPEGNGIEIYADRNPDQWTRSGAQVRMDTVPLDLDSLLRAADGTAWRGFPDGGRVGHVHLQVGDIARARAFYADVLGFDIATNLPSALFFGSGGYHHQLAGNIWNSRGAGTRPADALGLEAVNLTVADPATLARIAARAGVALDSSGSATLTLTDPWGTTLHLRA